MVLAFPILFAEGSHIRLNVRRMTRNPTCCDLDGEDRWLSYLNRQTSDYWRQTEPATRPRGLILGAHGPLL